MNRISISNGKRAKKNNKVKTGRIIFTLVIIIITVLIILKFNSSKQDNNFTDGNTTEQVNQIISNDIAVEPSSEKKDEIVSVEDMPKFMSAKTGAKYTVVGKIVIEKINVEKYILDRTTDNSLDLAVTKFPDSETGPKINEVGNYAITGHNYKGIFKRLKELVVGDEFYLVGSDGRKVTYKIYDKYVINPENEDCLDQNTNGKREVTLITCEPGAVNRLILKAEEKI